MNVEILNQNNSKHLGCDFVSLHTNTQIYKRILEIISHQMVSSVFLLFSGWFCWCMDNTNVQMRKYVQIAVPA
jgi:hypothetical protein